MDRKKWSKKVAVLASDPGQFILGIFKYSVQIWGKVSWLMLITIKLCKEHVTSSLRLGNNTQDKESFGRKSLG